MPHPDPASPTIHCLRTTICGFLLPFFLSAAGGNTATAQAAILELIDAYNARTITELDLVGRIVGFGIVAMDNLRLSMTQDMSDTKVLRYRSNAVALSRAAEQARQILHALQEKQETTLNIPRPAVAAAPAPVTPPKLQPSRNNVAPIPATKGLFASLSKDMETMQREARIMMGAFSKHGASAIQMTRDPSQMATSAAQAAVAAARRS
jgi:hypothetical protein